ncbi:calcium-binding protein [Methylobacterium trifolii]|uniref:Calcium-binding protein n=1 Tax=Methylobacterium trifolii TaxID=1003092 RepID=A0ABQ4U3Q6_9HYPH|nr:calcium-binding protein [Methylobacterium trifolii]GJE61386.1 hypothetical protein MPOCJGCO_3508 [Methylobacterium trifolii]
MAVPTNDEITNATIITGPIVTQSTTGATGSSGEDLTAEASAPLGSTVWYQYTATSSGVIEFNTNGSNFDTTLQAFQATNGAAGPSYGNLTEIASNDDNGTGRDPSRIEFLASTVRFTATAGQTYYIQAGGRRDDVGGVESGSLVLNVLPTVGGPTNGDDNLTGTSGPDYVLLLAGNDTYSGGLGDDTVFGNQGNDVLFGNQGNDTLFGGQDQDTLYGGQGDDAVLGNLGNDVVLGNLGNDTLFGGQGSDTLYGGQGNDVLFGDFGNDVLSGDLGADRYVFGQNSGADLVLGFSQAQGDRLDLSGQTYTLASAGNGDALLTLSGGGTVQLAGVQAGSVSAGFFA